MNEDEKDYRVIKRVTEYYSFIVSATSLEEAEAKAEECYCDVGCAGDTYVEVESVELVQKE